MSLFSGCLSRWLVDTIHPDIPYSDDKHPGFLTFYYYLSRFNDIQMIPQLVGGLEHFLFSHILGIIIPIDFHIFRGVQTTNQSMFVIRKQAEYVSRCPRW